MAGEAVSTSWMITGASDAIELRENADDPDVLEFRIHSQITRQMESCNVSSYTSAIGSFNNSVEGFAGGTNLTFTSGSVSTGMKFVCTHTDMINGERGHDSATAVQAWEGFSQWFPFPPALIGTTAGGS